jgi:hypothetical protein
MAGKIAGTITAIQPLLKYIAKAWRELEPQLKGHHQLLADMVLHITTDSKASDSYPADISQQFPSLKSLTVIHAETSIEETSLVYVRVRRFLGPHLQKLNVSFQAWCLQRLLPIN